MSRIIIYHPGMPNRAQLCLSLTIQPIKNLKKVATNTVLRLIRKSGFLTQYYSQKNLLHYMEKKKTFSSKINMQLLEIEQHTPSKWMHELMNSTFCPLSYRVPNMLYYCYNFLKVLCSLQFNIARRKTYNQTEENTAGSTREQGIPEIQGMQLSSIDEQYRQAGSCILYRPYK